MHAGSGGGGALGVLLLLVANGANKALNRGRLVVSDSESAARAVDRYEEMWYLSS